MVNSDLKILATLLVACSLFISCKLLANEDLALGKQVYTTCSACHLATGEGIPGAFPPLNNKHKMATLEGGKNYVISVVLQGINGPLTIGGTQYNGYMQAFAMNFTDSEIAAVLNYVTTEVSVPSDKTLSPFTQTDVANIRQKIALGNWPKSRELRSSLPLE